MRIRVSPLKNVYPKGDAERDTVGIDKMLICNFMFIFYCLYQIKHPFQGLKYIC